MHSIVQYAVIQRDSSTAVADITYNLKMYICSTLRLAVCRYFFADEMESRMV